jgi:hypothetical protein
LYTVHPESTKKYKDLKATYWCNNMKREIAKYVKQRSTCQQVKAGHQRLTGMLKPLLIPKPPMTNRRRFHLGSSRLLIKSAHFIPVKVKDPMDKLAKLYVQNIVQLHGVPLIIVLDRDLILLVFVLAAFCWTKSLSCTVTDFTGMPYQFRVFKYSEFISLI